MPDHLTIRIDTREQRPWSFPPEAATVVRGTIKAGDYALDGDQDRFAIERKSLNDFIGSISSTWDQNRVRFGPRCFIVIVEADYRDCLFYQADGDELSEPQHNHPNITPGFVQKRIAELSYDYGVNVFFAGSPEFAAALAWRILYQRAKWIRPRS